MKKNKIKKYYFIVFTKALALRGLFIVLKLLLYSFIEN